MYEFAWLARMHVFLRTQSHTCSPTYPNNKLVALYVAKQLVKRAALRRACGMKISWCACQVSACGNAHNKFTVYCAILPKILWKNNILTIHRGTISIYKGNGKRSGVTENNATCK